MACSVAELENSPRPQSYRIYTRAGQIVPKLQKDGKVVVDMGQPILITQAARTEGNAWLICLEVHWRLSGTKKISSYGLDLEGFKKQVGVMRLFSAHNGCLKHM